MRLCHQTTSYHRYNCYQNDADNIKLSRIRVSMAGDNHEEETSPRDNGDLPPLFFEAKDASARSIISDVPESLLRSIERARARYLSTDNVSSNENLLKQIVELTNSKKQTDITEQLSGDDERISFQRMERVPGCVATVHVKTTLVPQSASTNNNNPNEYRVVLQGTSDALLSGGLVELLSQILAGTDDIENKNGCAVTASDVLKLKPETLTTALGLQNVLSRGRNDGMASMVRVVQSQIQSLIDDTTSVGEANEESSEKTVEPTSVQTSKSNGSEERQPTVAMLLSGGVDSSVAMHLLLRQNFNVTAFYLRIWLEDELAHLGECPWEDDLQVCQSVCDHAGNVTLETVSLGKEYRERVVQYTIDEARKGRTPNPDIMCNSRIKFGCFLEYIEKSGLDFDYVASGHYARLDDDDDATSPRKRLFRAPDPVKDQSYFLCALTQKQLSKVIFPIGMYQKAEVRELANEFQLPNRNRPDSQGLCFLGKVKFDEFLASYLGNRPGDVVDAMTGDIIGHHNGLWYHTVGQRKGIGKVMFPLATAHGPWYVVAKNQEQDIVYVSNRYDEDDFARARSEFELEDIKWISGEPPIETRDADSKAGWNEVRFDLKIRHGPKIVQGNLMLNGDGSTGNVSLDNKDGGLAPGQYVVFYRIGTLECLGAGVISEKHWARFLQTQKTSEMMASEDSSLEKR
jgi:tRNA (5-methylaminomethyl-2-thiouridylate)-methyltransferase